MSRIRGKNTQPELIVRSFLHRAGLRFRVHDRTLPGTPDIVLPRWRTIVFVHGCFWHQHEGCRYAYKPKSNKTFWRDKLLGNAARDQRHILALRQKGWKVVVQWECQLDLQHLQQTVEQIRLGNK